MQYVDSTVEKQRRQADRAHEMLVQLQSVAESMQIAHEQQTLLLKNTLDNNLQKLQNKWDFSSNLILIFYGCFIFGWFDLLICFCSLLDKLNKTVSDTVKGNLAQGFKQQKAVIEESVLTSLNAVRSRAVSPAQSVSDYASMERRVLNFIQERDYNSAFQQVYIILKYLRHLFLTTVNILYTNFYRPYQLQALLLFWLCVKGLILKRSFLLNHSLWNKMYFYLWFNSSQLT